MLKRVLATMALWLATCSAAAEYFFGQEFNETERFSLTCSTAPAFTASTDGPTEKELRTWTINANLTNSPVFSLRYNGQSQLAVNLMNGEELSFELSSVSSKLVDARRLVTFVTTDIKNKMLGKLHIRFPVAETNDWTQSFVLVDHGKFSSDPFGGRGYYRAKYYCATPKQLDNFDVTQNALCTTPFEGIYNCNG